jgi:hypothetical protein
MHNTLVAFLHPKSTLGVLIELVQHQGERARAHSGIVIRSYFGGSAAKITTYNKAREPVGSNPHIPSLARSALNYLS